MKKLLLSIFVLAVVFSCSKDDETPIPECTVPGNLQVTNISQTSVTITWESSNADSSFILEYGESGFALGTGTIVNTTSTSYTINNLAANTTYDYYLTANCGNGNESDPTSVRSFTTLFPLVVAEFLPNLSELNLFEGDLENLRPSVYTYEYDLITPLFTDYAHKKRFVWMPQGVNAQYVNDYSVLDFPIGTILIKSFYYENVLPNNTTRIIETRLMIRKENEWVFANYIWNDEQTEAVMDNVGGYTLVEWVQNGETLSTNYRIPSESECFTCHKIGATNTPIGPKPQNLNKIYGYDSGSENQLEKLATMGYLNSDYPTDIETVVNWEDTSQPLDLRVRSYLDINCAHCHSDDRHCNYRPMRFAFNESWDEANLGVCVEPQELFDGLNYIVSPNNINRSMLYFRVSTTLAQRRMPLLGRTLVHEEAVALIEDWINSLTTTCD
ncbi:MAG: fibronectin type III domain-containing protein [Mangrovimonas sp.]|nr:fibronectin type III domain-containing protein [Mangrovimonas sp.]